MKSYDDDHQPPMTGETEQVGACQRCGQAECLCPVTQPRCICGAVTQFLCPVHFSGSLPKTTP